MGWKWAAHMAGIVTLMDAVLVGAVGVLSRQPLGVPWRPQALQKPSCQDARGTFLSGGQSECGELQHATVRSKRYDPLLRHAVEGVHELGSLSYEVWRDQWSRSSNREQRTGDVPKENRKWLKDQLKGSDVL